MDQTEIDEVNESMVKETLSRSFKATRDYYKHLLKCESCMQKYAEITKCVMKNVEGKKSKRRKNVLP